MTTNKNGFAGMKRICDHPHGGLGRRQAVQRNKLRLCQPRSFLRLYNGFESRIIFTPALGACERLPVLGWGDSHMALEYPGEMALVGKARRQGDLAKRRVGRGHLPASEIEPELAYISSDRIGVVGVKHVGEIGGADADVARNFSQCERLGKPVAQELSGLFEPAWRT